MTEQLKVSFSRLAAFKNCPEYFRRRYLTQEHQDQNVYALAGVLFHNAVEHDHNPHDPEMLALAIKHKGKHRGPDVVNRALKALPAYTAFMQDDGQRPELAREHEMWLTWTDDETQDEIRFHGFADRVSQGDKGLIIDDWKLGSKRPTDVAQLHTYAPLVARQFDQEVSLLRAVYLKQNGKYEVKAFVPTMGYDEVIDLMTDMGQMLYRSGYYPAWGALNGQCRVCPFENSCPWAGMSSQASIKMKKG